MKKILVLLIVLGFAGLAFAATVVYPNGSDQSMRQFYDDQNRDQRLDRLERQQRQEQFNRQQQKLEQDRQDRLNGKINNWPPRY